MKDSVDTKLKAEIDEIMKNVDDILKKVETLYPTENQTTSQNQDQQIT